MLEGQRPPGALINHDHEIDAAVVARPRYAMREHASLVIGEGAALPVSNIDGAIRASRLSGGNGDHAGQQRGDNEFELHLGPPPEERAYCPLQPESNALFLICSY